jgi:hypothetical protein
VYRSLGAPGVVLSAGEIAGTWRQRKAGATLKVEISPWKQLTADERDEVEADAALVADSRGLRPQVQWQPA